MAVVLRIVSVAEQKKHLSEAALSGRLDQIEAAKLGRLVQMLFSSVPLTIRRTISKRASTGSQMIPELPGLTPNREWGILFLVFQPILPLMRIAVRVDMST